MAKPDLIRFFVAFGQFLHAPSSRGVTGLGDLIAMHDEIALHTMTRSGVPKMEKAHVHVDCQHLCTCKMPSHGSCIDCVRGFITHD